MKINLKQISIFALGVLFLFVSIFTFVPGTRPLMKGSAAAMASFVLDIYDPFAKTKVVFGPYGNKPKAAKAERLDDYLRSQEKFSLQVAENPGIRRQTSKFSYESHSEEKLNLLSDKYGLRRFITDPDFSGMVDLRCWLAGTLKHTDNPRRIMRFNNFDALEVLQAAESGERFMCGEAAYAYVQCALSIGAQARVVLIEDEKGAGHAVCEVWSNQFRKWVVMDPDYNIHYERAGVPQDAFELHRALMNREIEDITVVKGFPQPEGFGIDDLEGKGLERYFNFGVRMRNDFFRVYPAWHKKANTYVNVLEWKDKETPGRPDFIWQTNKFSDLYYDVNTSSVYVAGASINGDEAVITLSFETFTPNFDHFYIESDSIPFSTRQAKYLWKLGKGRHSLIVQAVNSWGVKGSPCKFEVINQ